MSPDLTPLGWPLTRFRQIGLLNADTGGLRAVYGVIVRRDCAKNLRLLAHEFVHVAQYEDWEQKD